MRLSSVRVDRYGPLSGIEHEFDGGIEVLYGPNESGKTLLLDAILRLCSPDAVDVLPDVGRVEESPVGHAVLELGGAGGDHPTGGGIADGDPSTATGVEEHVLGDGTALTDLTDVTARQLRNVFVVRDADLRLGDEHAFYDATARKLADLHTAEIDALRERVVDAGRLTPTTLNLARAEEHGNPRDVREDAADLAERLREYVAECREAGVESAERERVTVATELERTRETLDRQRAAETLATRERCAEQLEVVREATDRLADRACTEDGLERLEAIDDDLDRIADDLEDCEDRREALREERSALESECGDLAADLAPIEDRLREAEAVEEALDRYRERATHAGDGRAVRLGVAIAVAGAIGAGGAAVAGTAAVALGLSGLAVLGAVWAIVRRRRARAAAADRSAVLATARDAGLAVETIGDVAPAIRDVRDERDRLEGRTDSIDGELDLVDRRLDDVVAEREDLIERRRELRRERRGLLRDAGAPDVEAYRDAVETADSLAAERREAAASLAERLGEADAAGFEDRIEHWEAELEALEPKAPDAEVTAEAYDPDRRERLVEEVATLEDRLAALDERLDDHEAAIARFADDLGRLPTGRFRDEPIGLAARSVDGLAATARDLESLVDDLERDADVSRAAVAALDAVQADEEAKLAELFGPESTASATFAPITGGRYDAVTYDPAVETLLVHDGDGATVTPRELSRGATDQLYLATRIGLAERLLAGEHGFLLLDDPLLPADPERLAAAFDALRSLAADGWQVVYFTAKPEVGEELVERHGVPCRRFERLA